MIHRRPFSSSVFRAPIQRRCAMAGAQGQHDTSAGQAASGGSAEQVPDRLMPEEKTSPFAGASNGTPAPASFVPPPPTNGQPDAAPYLRGMQQLFTTKDTSMQDKVISEMYAKKVVFDDNIVHVGGHANMKAQFHTLAKCFRNINVTVNSTEWVDDKNGKILNIQNKQTYALGKRNIELDVKTEMHVGPDGLVTMHKDRWQGKWTSFYPLRWGLGNTTSLMLRLFRV